MLRILFQWFKFGFKWFEFEFECFESLASSSNLHLNATNESLSLFEFRFEWFEYLSNGSNLDSNASNPFRTVRIDIQMLRIPLEWLEF